MASITSGAPARAAVVGFLAAVIAVGGIGTVLRPNDPAPADETARSLADMARADAEGRLTVTTMAQAPLDTDPSNSNVTTPSIPDGVNADPAQVAKPSDDAHQVANGDPAAVGTAPIAPPPGATQTITAASGATKMWQWTVPGSKVDDLVKYYIATLVTKPNSMGKAITQGNPSGTHAVTVTGSIPAGPVQILLKPSPTTPGGTDIALTLNP